MSEPMSDRRVTVRWASSQQAPCHFATLDKIGSRWARVVNVSMQGIGLLMPCQLESGMELHIEMPSKDLAPNEALTAEVVHVRKAADGNWSIGCTFAKPLSEEQLQSLL